MISYTDLLQACHTETDVLAWRQEAAEQIAALISSKRYGVKAVYLIGSVCAGTPSVNSDIDLIIHITGNSHQYRELRTVLQQCNELLCQHNFWLTGYMSDYILDVHYITDSNIENQTSFASKICSVDDPAELLYRADRD